MKASIVFGVLTVLLIASNAVAAPIWYSITGTQTNYRVQQGQTTGAIAEAYLDVDSVKSTGWATLGLYTRSKVQASFSSKAHAAGYLEGFLTAGMIWDSYGSTLASSFGDGVTSIPSTSAKFLSDNIAWAKSQVQANTHDAYWTRVGYTITLLEGIVAGYNAATDAGHQLSLLEVWFLNSDGDMEEIAALQQVNSVGGGWRYKSRKVAKVGSDGLPTTVQPIGSHCSVLVKVTSDFSNLFLGHTTWEDFVEMLRVYKVYDLDFYGTRVTFSSYPAVVTSIDDFYATSNKLAVTETTNGIFTESLYDKIVPEALLSWTRAMQANVEAKSCAEWMRVFGKYNSGTYNNQWICADYNLFTPKRSLAAGTLWIGEQIPGLWMTKDVTSVLSYGYWPSYNIPYFQEIYNVSGFGTQPNYNDFFSYELCPRAKIFRRDHHKVVDVPSMQRIMRYNDWQNDPYADGNPCLQIASRCDLVQGRPSNPDTQLSAFGSVDGKIVDYHSIQQGVTYAQAGPTWDQQAPFTWTNPLWTSQPHSGQPDTFKFEWQAMKFP